MLPAHFPTLHGDGGGAKVCILPGQRHSFWLAPHPHPKQRLNPWMTSPQELRQMHTCKLMETLQVSAMLRLNLPLPAEDQ